MFDEFLDISARDFICTKTFSLAFLYIEVWFADQNYEPLEIENKTNITSIIN